MFIACKQVAVQDSNSPHQTLRYARATSHLFCVDVRENYGPRPHLDVKQNIRCVGGLEYYAHRKENHEGTLRMQRMLAQATQIRGRDPDQCSNVPMS